MQTAVQNKLHHQLPTWIEIDTDRAIANLNSLKERFPETQNWMTVIKANAYGHGLVPIAKALDSHVDFLGIANASEAMELNEHHLDSTLFLFGQCEMNEIGRMPKNSVFGISSFDEARQFSEWGKQNEEVVRIHVKVDTGMGRLGIPFHFAFKEIERIALLPNTKLEGIYSHFPNADPEDSTTLKQVGDLTLLIKALEQKDITFAYKHIANSAGCFVPMDEMFNLNRPGILIYGIYNKPELKNIIDVKPVLKLKSRVIHTKELRPGDSTGYDQTFVASKPTTIAILPIGYSHGYPYSASHKASVLFHGEQRPILGKISMDFMAIDITGLHCPRGTEVTLIGSEGSNMIHVEDIANWADTIPYEIVTQLSPRLPRLITTDEDIA